ncbi:hypothetical protein BGZ80_004826 [Entomortierella chlamydospora]|uniref:Thioredoxin domain-containing protein n=1 Tax=Entomortierella chlamydospora TaxID=101097 RepID=A0A9P6MMD0_9FUNG|nr:hypothetical protein BGZ79_008012 [Entomortierella chlamydospora]KAG0007308.1 hypothetical protein BGZ80_004826 [Entomortierella chlamydospora]
MFMRGILSAAIAIAACSSSAHASAASKNLVESDFDSYVADEPVWEQVAVEHKDWKRTRGFKFAEVDCLAQGGLCEDHDIVSYPTTMLYYKGKVVTKYTKKRTLEKLTEFVEDMGSEYINVPEGVSLKEVGDVKTNALGLVVNLDNESFYRRTAFGPWLVEYYAPWCGHCQALAPIYDELATQLKGKVNVAKVDCTRNEDICRKQKVPGYPTIKLHQFNSEIEYNKHRTLEHMTQFALGAVVPSVKPMDSNDLENIKHQNDVSFVYIHDSKTNPEITSLIDTQSQVFYDQISLYESSDAALASELSVSSPGLVALKNNRLYKYEGSLTDDQAVRKWIVETRDPLVITLTPENTGRILSKRGWTALGLFDPSKPATVNARHELIETAYKYYETISERSPLDGQPLRFVILDASLWENYVRGAFNLEMSQLPVVVVINSREEIFYPYGLNGHNVPVEEEALLNYFTHIESGILVPKSMLSTVQKTFRFVQKQTRPVVKFATERPMMALFIATAFLLAIMRRFAPEAPQEGEAKKKEGEEGGKDIKQD